MAISPLAAAALRVINAAWMNGTSYDLASQAAFALEAAGLLKAPEAAAEDRWNTAAVQRVRDLVAYWVGIEGGEQAAEAIESVLLGTHRPLPTATDWAWDGGRPSTTEAERLRARVAELEQQATTARAAGYAAAIEIMRQEKLPMSVGLLEAQRELDALDAGVSPWQRAVDGLNALVDAGIGFHVEPDGHISNPAGDEHIEWDRAAKRWRLVHNDETKGQQSPAGRTPPRALSADDSLA
ncbi:hypothetical protein [Streptomyces kronopolitis]|uniref:hypothetical protein n=1 Tax=Streptomyces kronopolitis TaxID=1612435 RepID=UPI003D9A0781